jgi:hypothetical protein
VADHHRAGRCAIAIMAKAPDAGRVKTRLLPLLRAEEARELSACFLADMTGMLAAAGRDAAIDGYIAFAPAGSEASFAPIVAAGTGYVLADGTIGAPAGVVGFGCCLLQAAQALFALGYGAVGLLNSDSPNLPAALIIETARLLAQPGDRAVLGPATDGGYYLLGIKAPHAELFAHIDWSTARVAAQTRAAAQRTGLTLADLPAWYDVDDPASLKQLVRDLDGARTPSPHRGEDRGEGVPGPSGPHSYAAPFTVDWLSRHAVAERLAAMNAAQAPK